MPVMTTSAYTQAQTLFVRKDFNGALNVLSSVLEKNPQDVAALVLAGDIYVAGNNAQQAIGYYGLAVQAAPDNLDAKRKFIRHAGQMAFQQYNQAIADILCLCLQTPEVECAQAQVLWYTLIRSHPQLVMLMNNAFKTADYVGFLQTPLFLWGVKRIVVCNMEFENFMTGLRRFLLQQRDARYNALLEAMATYCFNTDYIFNRNEDEEKAAAALHDELQNDPGARQDVIKTGLYACYEPFYKLDIAPAMSYLPGVKAILDDYLDLQQRAANIPSLTGITDAVSIKVREQYEEFPYPRWRELPFAAPVAEDSFFGTPGLQVLIAGCGTGQEAVLLGQSCPKAEILGIDLSRASLAYASRKIEEFGINNITLQHADILQLGTLDRTFHYICSSGVLHHMQNPVAGWRVLTDLLRPHGLMRIGLYSATARRAVTAAREIIAREHYPATPEGMRHFRKDGMKLLGNAFQARVLDSMDYYHLNMYRDLLFHVQEHQFTLPQIQEILDDLGLEFLEFFGQRTQPGLKTLADWDKAEQANPDLFSGMYNFWCRKKS